MSGEPSIEDAIDHLERILPIHAPWLWESLAPPAAEEEIAALRKAFDPYPIAAEVISYLRRWNGQTLVVGHSSAPDWPLFYGRLSSIAEMIEARQFADDEEEEYEQRGMEWQHSRSWVTLASRSHERTASSVLKDGQSLVIDAAWGHEHSVIAPSLALVFDATATVATEGLLLSPHEENTLARDEFNARWMNLDARAKGIFRSAWAGPYAPNELVEPATWPAEWRKIT